MKGGVQQRSSKRASKGEQRRAPGVLVPFAHFSGKGKPKERSATQAR